MNCEQPCDINQFKCKFGECVDKRKVCDYSEDCSNGADEHNCGIVLCYIFLTSESPSFESSSFDLFKELYHFLI